MDIPNKATRISLFSLSTRPMRAIHMSWCAFFLGVFAWFGIAPLMAVVREELGLTKTEIGNTIIASVAITIFARFFIGWTCDRIGPCLCYTWLLILGSLPVMGIGFAHSYEPFLLFRAESITWPIALLILGAIATLTSFLALGVKFSATDEAELSSDGAPSLWPCWSGEGRGHSRLTNWSRTRS